MAFQVLFVTNYYCTSHKTQKITTNEKQFCNFAIVLHGKFCCLCYCLLFFKKMKDAETFSYDVTLHHHRHVSSRVTRLRMLRATTSQPDQSIAFLIFHSAFLLTGHKSLQQDHCSSIFNALILMITGVFETFAVCRLHRFHWLWFSL